MLDRKSTREQYQSSRKWLIRTEAHANRDVSIPRSRTMYRRDRQSLLVPTVSLLRRFKINTPVSYFAMRKASEKPHRHIRKRPTAWTRVVRDTKAQGKYDKREAGIVYWVGIGILRKSDLTNVNISFATPITLIRKASYIEEDSCLEKITEKGHGKIRLRFFEVEHVTSTFQNAGASSAALSEYCNSGYKLQFTICEKITHSSEVHRKASVKAR